MRKILAAASIILLPSVAQAHEGISTESARGPLEYAGLLLLTYSPVIVPAIALLIKYFHDRKRFRHVSRVKAGN